MKRAPLRFEVLRTDEELEGFAPAWTELHAEAGSRNPFAHPAWLLTWLRQFVPDPGRRRILTIFRGDSLVAVAPYYERQIGGGKTRAAHGGEIPMPRSWKKGPFVDDHLAEKVAAAERGPEIARSSRRGLGVPP